MQPFYFRNSGKSLFGIYYPPSGERVRNCGIVICHPIGHEYIHGYRALRQLAHQLARAGFAVLRFDYYGCGDSAGDFQEGSLTQWLADIREAIREIESRGSISKISLIGARVGGALAVLLGGERPDIESVVLWDPVVNGSDYLSHLLAQQQEWLDARPPIIHPPGLGDKAIEVLGFPISAALKENIEQINLLTLKVRPAKRVLTLETDRTGAGAELSAHLKQTGAESEYRHISTPLVWVRRPGADNVVVPAPILQAIVSWISGIEI
jgi:exosortase A-associated hydrolase 2